MNMVAERFALPDAVSPGPAGPGAGRGAANADVAADVAALKPLPVARRRWPVVVGGLLTAAMVAGLLRELLASGTASLTRAVPADPRFYLLFALLYLSPVVGDYVIFRRLWGIPFAGFVALVKKRISNEVLLGYSGEAYFYAWARARASMVAAPFGAVKDVSILSAIAGNAMTLLMVALALAFGRSLVRPEMMPLVDGSVAITIATSLPFLLFSRRVFTLGRGTLWWIFAVHVARVSAGTVLTALAWHFALPQVPVGTWLLLSAGKLLVSRLPLVPNKDLVFANFAILLIGRSSALSSLMAFSAALVLVVHLTLIAGFAMAGLLTGAKGGRMVAA